MYRSSELLHVPLIKPPALLGTRPVRFSTSRVFRNRRLLLLTANDLISPEKFFTGLSSRLIHPVWWKTADNPSRTYDYGIQIHCFTTKLYRLSMGKTAIVISPLLRFFFMKQCSHDLENSAAKTLRAVARGNRGLF